MLNIKDFKIVPYLWCGDILPQFDHMYQFFKDFHQYLWLKPLSKLITKSINSCACKTIGSCSAYFSNLLYI